MSTEGTTTCARPGTPRPGVRSGTPSLGVVATQTVAFEEGIRLEAGAVLRPLTVAFEIYGEPNARRDNVILVCHALSGGAHAAGLHAGATKPGWWDITIGPGKAFDTSRYCVISSNVVGSCYGTTGPGSIDPATGRPYGSRFPVVMVRDMVNVQRLLLDRLGIDSLLAVAGGSMGGMQALQWAASYPERVRGVIAIATTARHSAQQIAFDEVARQAITNDPAWNGGDYYDGPGPVGGLAVARMLGHVTYLSDRGMAGKFGRQPCAPEVAGPADAKRLGFVAPQFEVERYLQHQGESFVRRFDANSVICLTRAMDAFDLGAGHASLVDTFARSSARFLLISFSSDWLYPPYQVREIARAIAESRGAAMTEPCGDRDVTYREIASDYGHDAFLLEHAQQAPLIEAFLGVLQAEA